MQLHTELPVARLRSGRRLRGHIDGRSSIAKRIRQLVAEYTAIAGKRADAADIRRAAELVALTERARHVALVTGKVAAPLVAAELAARRAVKALGITDAPPSFDEAL